MGKGRGFSHSHRMKFITIPNVLKKNKPEELVIVVSGAKLGSDICRDMFE